MIPSISVGILKKTSVSVSANIVCSASVRLINRKFHMSLQRTVRVLSPQLKSGQLSQDLTPIHGVIFDLDGTLVPPGIDFAKIRHQLGIPVGTDIITFINQLPSEKVKEAWDLVHHEEEVARKRNTKNGLPVLIEGCIELMHFLDTHNIKRAILTRNNEEVTSHFLRGFESHLNNHFSASDSTHGFWPVVTREVEPVKPDPRAALNILETWEIEPQHSIFVGDFKDDLDCGRGSSMATALITTHSTWKDFAHLADVHVDTLHELQAALHQGISVYR